MGAMYRAEDLGLGRDVAIKVIRHEHVASLRGPAAQLAVDRFLQEAPRGRGAVAPGGHHGARIGTEGGAGWPYIAMEWLEGRTLEALRGAKRSVFSGIDALSDKEGFVRIGARSGLHVLLIEETEGERRPLEFE